MFGKTLTMTSADKLRLGQLVTINTHFFPKGEDDAMAFWSEKMTIKTITDNYVELIDEYGETVPIPIEDYKTSDGSLHKCIKPPLGCNASFYIWVIHDNLADSIVDTIKQLLPDQEQK